MMAAETEAKETDHDDHHANHPPRSADNSDRNG